MVFDWQNNQQRTGGPGLTNQLVAVLIRFGQEPVAVIGDIESMFYRFGFLKNIDVCWDFYGRKMGTSITHQLIMKLVDMFLVVFHHPVAVIMHWRRQHDNKLKYELEATDILNKYFYVDDILKSVASVPEAITLVKMLKACAGLVVLD